jgi:hypothetical protein
MNNEMNELNLLEKRINTKFIMVWASLVIITTIDVFITLSYYMFM